MEKRRTALLLSLIVALVLFFYYLFESVREPNFWYEGIYLHVYRYQEVEFWVVFIVDIIIIIGAFIAVCSFVKCRKVGSIICLIAGITGIILSYCYPYSKFYFYQYPNIYYFELLMYILIVSGAVFGLQSRYT